MFTITIIMSTYNCAATLPKAMDSLLEQTYPHWELVACDDGSTDGSYAILQDYATRYPDKIRLLRNEENRGLPFSLNRCLAEAKTEYIARMDGDDLSRPERLAKQIAYLQAHPEVDMVGTAAIVTNGREELTRYVQPAQVKIEDFRHCTCFIHATVLCKRQVLEALGGYSLEPHVLRCEDLDLWSRFLAAGCCGHNLQEPLYVILEDDAAIKRRTWKNRRNVAKTLRIAFRRLHLRGFSCLWRSYGQLLTYFVPTPLYRLLHVRRISAGSRENAEKP